MENIRQTCPQCKSTLELPASAIGRMARCPACQNTFRVEATGSLAGGEEFTIPPTQLPPSPGPPNKATGPNPYSGEATPTLDYSNPYAMNPGMAVGGDILVEKGAIAIRKASIDRIVSASLAIFSARWQPLVLSGIVFFVLQILIYLISMASAVAAEVQGAEIGAFINAGTTFFTGMLNWYFYLGLINVGLKVARGEEATPANAFVSLNIYGHLIGLIFVLSTIGALAQLFPLALNAAGDPTVLMYVGLLAASVTGLLAGLFLWTTWPALYLGVDERASGIKAIPLGFQIGTTNLLNGFLMGLISVALSIAATLTCCVGSIVTTPLMLLIGSVAYLMMTSQPISDPNATPYHPPNYKLN